MSSEIETPKKFNWRALVPHLIILGIIVVLFYRVEPSRAILYGALSFIVLSFLLKKLIPGVHRRGVKKNKMGDFDGAITDFKKSYAFFKKHEWLDKYRYLFLLSSSRISYREVALANTGFCYLQLGEKQKSIEYYKKTLDEFPESNLAKAALKNIRLSENSPNEKLSE